jgi:arabinogalactan oligomer/maltooligosaccharide transport system substrate-binding protein
MLAKGLSGDKLKAAQDFIGFVLSEEKQIEMVKLLNRLPALKEALEDPLVTENPILKGSSDQMVVGTPMPTVLEMRCNWDSMKPEMLAVLTDTKSPEDAAKAMQTSVESCIKALE